MKTILFISLLLCLSIKTSLASVDNSTRFKEVADSPNWLALLHMNSHDDNLTSYVDDNAFFLSLHSGFTPENELIATYKSLLDTPTIQCKFPARTVFLKSEFKELSQKVPVMACPEYEKWRKRLNTSSVVLVFASAQLNSPSSMYGHTFLRFDPEDVEKHSTYLSYALNFGATVPDDAGGFSYALRGLTGGYPGNFAANPYFEKIKEYNRLENRDLWEYKLNLSQAEINTMLDHIWELKGINFEYYFFDENCSFRLLELLDVARPGLNLVDNFPLTTMPLDTVRVVQEADLITDIHYRASILTELETLLAGLSHDERQLVLALSADISVLTSAEFIALPTAKQQVIVDSAYRYLRYQNTFNGRKKTITKRSFALLKQLNKYETQIELTVATPARPDQSHETGMWSIGGGQNDEQNFMQLQYRGSYHDLIDPPAGYYSGMSLNMVNIKLRVYEEDDVVLEKAELLDIVSLSDRNAFFSPWSWQANVSLEQQWTAGKERLVGQGSGGGGVSYQPFDHSHFFVMAKARLEFNNHLDSFAAIAPGLHAGFLYNWQHIGLLVEAEHYQFLFDQTARTRYSVEQSWHLNKNSSLRLLIEHNKINSLLEKYDYEELKLEFRRYF